MLWLRNYTLKACSGISSVVKIFEIDRPDQPVDILIILHQFELLLNLINDLKCSFGKTTFIYSNVSTIFILNSLVNQ